MPHRIVVLDTETTGLSPTDGHRVAEIGCIEIIDRRLTGQFRQWYLDPEREFEAGASAVTGLTWEKLRGQPKFMSVAEPLCEFLKGAEWVIHNMAFDLGFLESEFQALGWSPQQFTRHAHQITDTLLLARARYRGQPNNLDALSKRLGVKQFERKQHGALLDARILAQVYLGLTAEQFQLEALLEESESTDFASALRSTARSRAEKPSSAKPLKSITLQQASPEEVLRHEARMNRLKAHRAPL